MSGGQSGGENGKIDTFRKAGQEAALKCMRNRFRGGAYLRV